MDIAYFVGVRWQILYRDSAQSEGAVGGTGESAADSTVTDTAGTSPAEGMGHSGRVLVQCGCML